MVCWKKSLNHLFVLFVAFKLPICRYALITVLWLGSTQCHDVGGTPLWALPQSVSLKPSLKPSLNWRVSLRVSADRTASAISAARTKRTARPNIARLILLGERTSFWKAKSLKIQFKIKTVGVLLGKTFRTLNHFLLFSVPLEAHQVDQAFIIDSQHDDTVLLNYLSTTKRFRKNSPGEFKRVIR